MPPVLQPENNRQKHQMANKVSDAPPIEDDGLKFTESCNRQSPEQSPEN